MKQLFDSEKFADDYGVCLEENVEESELEEKEELQWEELLRK